MDTKNTLREMLLTTYGNDLLILIEGSKCKDTSYSYLAIVRSDCEITPIDGCQIVHYSDDFESLVDFTLPSKTRKPKELLSLSDTEALFDRITYGTLAFDADGIPYNFGINHVYVDGKLYFHCGRKGFKLCGLGKRACFTVIEDLGPALAGTHNFRTLQVFGILKANEDPETKKRVMTKMIEHVNPHHPPFIDANVVTTTLIEMDTEFMIGRKNIYK